jgi:cation diffusion facilitator CzcD-associated flavoprotein CzcO
MKSTTDNVTRQEARHYSGDKPLELLVIGTGFSGICAGIKLLEAGISNFR